MIHISVGDFELLIAILIGVGILCGVLIGYLLHYSKIWK